MKTHAQPQTASRASRAPAPVPLVAATGRGAVRSALEAPASAHADVAVPRVVREVLCAPGRPLESGTRAYLEPRLGHDLRDVRVHTGAPAATAARALDATAFTVGRHIVFDAGRYAPATREGRRLLAHELAHVIQQRRGGPTPDRDAAAAHERDAHDAARAIDTGVGSVAVRGATGVGVACQPAKPPSAAHAGGAMGERDAAFVLGQRGIRFVIGPGGAGGHALTERGLDLVGLDPATGDLWIVDNKASGGTGRIREATALVTNLQTNLAAAIEHVRRLEAFPEKSEVLAKLEATRAAVRSRAPLPAGVRLVVTNAGGYATGIGKDLAAQGVQFADLVGPDIIQTRRADVKAARAVGARPGRPVVAEPAGAPERSPEKPPAVVARTGASSRADEIAARIAASVQAHQARMERVRGVVVAISAALDQLSGFLAERAIRGEVEARLARSRFVTDTLAAGRGVFVVMRIDQWRIPDSNGNRVRVFNNLQLYGADSYADGMDQFLRASFIESSRGKGWETVSSFAFIPPPR